MEAGDSMGNRANAIVIAWMIIGAAFLGFSNGFANSASASSNERLQNDDVQIPVSLAEQGIDSETSDSEIDESQAESRVKDLSKDTFNKDANLAKGSHLATRNDIDAMKAKIGVRDPDKNYNIIYDGHGTGLAPPTEEEWEAMIDTLVIVDSQETGSGKGQSTLGGPLGATTDLMADPSFPAVGNQGSEGSCSSWAAVHYANGFMQAKDEGWTDQHGSYGTANKDHLMSVDWAYHKVNGGSDSGSSLVAPMRIVTTVGSAPESYMPYSTSDHTSWGNEDAWRMAPKYRAEGILTTEVTNIDVIKSWIDDGYAAVMALNAGQYSNGWTDGNGILSSAEYTPGSPNHANTVVGYNDSITDDGDTGAFKIVNSWGAGWGPYSNGTYWMTYEAFKTLVWGFANRYSGDKPDYEPTMLAVWNIDPQGARNAPVELGVGPYGDPEETRAPIWNGGSYDFPNFMALDITEFQDNRDAGTVMFYLEIRLGATSSTISSFKIESYQGGYTPGSPTEISPESPDTPETTPGYVTLWFPSSKGFVRLDNTDYKSDAMPVITLADGDLNANSSLAEVYIIDEVRSDPTGDSETTTTVLTEIGLDMGVFTGTIQLEPAAANPNDGILQVANGDIIMVRYDDADDGTGNPASVNDTAIIDDDPPVISAVTAVPSYLHATITWNTDEDSDSRVDYEEVPPLTSYESDSFLTTAHSIKLTGLSLETTYYFSVQSTDKAGNTAIDDNSGNYYSFTTLPPEVVPWSDDMESGPDFWTNESDEAGTEWQLGDPAGFGPGSAQDGSNCWGTNINSNYTDWAEAWLTIAPIDLTLAARANLTFWSWYNIEDDWDLGVVEVSTDLGATWTRMTPEGGYPSTSGIFGDGYSGTSSGWLSTSEEEFDLGPYLGNIVLIGFHFMTDAALVHSGWYLDNVTVNASYTPIGATITPSAQDQTGYPGDTISYQARIINIGNTPDTFDMEYFSPSGWTAFFYESDGITPLVDTNANIIVDTGSLQASGGFRDVVVKVNIPGDANATDTDDAVINATSTNDPSESDTASITTTVPYFIESKLMYISPTLDGLISPGEWDDAEAVDISSTSIPAGSVTLYVKNTDEMLYLAINDSADTTASIGDRMAIYFDDNHDHEWPPSSNITGEGNFWIDWLGMGTSCQYRGIWGDRPYYDITTVAAGVNAGVSYTTGNMQYEASIDLTTSAMQSTHGGIIGVFIFTRDEPTRDYYGQWPPNTLNTWRNPGTYGDLLLAVDSELPTSNVDGVTPYWQPMSPINLNATADDIGSHVISVELLYRYSDDNQSWGGWTSLGIDTEIPWGWSFDFPDGDGFYEMKSIAIDNVGNIEADTGTDISFGYDNSLPASYVNSITPYWQATSPLFVIATANDMTSGVARIELYYRSNNDNMTWGSWNSHGIDTQSPWIWTFDFPGGEGFYQFYSRSRDAAGNVESLTGIDALCGFDFSNPTADAGPDKSVDEDEAFMFSGSASTDSLGIVNWTWDLDDGTIAYGETGLHSYPEAGTYIVTLTVRDPAGYSDTDTLTVFVSNLAPVADAGPDQTVDEGDTVLLNGSGSSDTPSDLPNLVYTWYFEDGTVKYGITANHIFADDGTYTVTLMVADDNGFADSDNMTVEVNNLAPVADIGGPYSGDEGTQVQFSGSAYDPSDDTLTFNWDLDNDGQYDDATGLDTTWSWYDDGTYTISLMVTDDDGASSTDSTSIIVSNVAPTPIINGPYFGQEGTAISFNGDYTDPSPVDTVTFSWSFGDGQTSTEQNPAHVYSDNGVYVVTLTVADDDGGVCSVNTTAMISNLPPTISPIDVVTAKEGRTFSLNIEATDVDGRCRWRHTHFRGQHRHVRHRSEHWFDRVRSIGQGCRNKGSRHYSE
jgi:PKD repeat protein